MVEFIAEKFDIDVSVATISRILKKERISQKKVLRQNASDIDCGLIGLSLGATNCTRALSVAL